MRINLDLNNNMFTIHFLIKEKKKRKDINQDSVEAS